MSDKKKTKTGLIEELDQVQRRVSELENAAVRLSEAGTTHSDHERSEKTPRESHDIYEAIYRNASEGILVADVETRCFLHANPAICKMLGYAEEELRQMSVADIHPAETLDHVIAKFDALTRREIALAPDIPCLRADGAVIYADITTAEIIVDGRRCTVGHFADITERKRAQEIREREGQFRSLIDNMPGVAWTSDGKGQTTFISPNVESVYGYTPEEIYEGGASLWYGRIHEDDVDRVKVSFAELLEGDGRYDAEYRIRKKNGDWIWLNDRAIRTYDDQGVMRADGVFFDITDRKRAEQALKESEEFASSLLTNSPNPMLVINPDTSIRYVNPALEKLTGFSSAELIGTRTPYPWWTEETLQKTSIDLKTAMREGATRLEELFQKRNKERFRVEITSTAVKTGAELKYYLENWVDITERKKADRTLRECKMRYRALTDNLPVGVYRSTPEGRVLSVNPALLHIFGYNTEDEYLSKPAVDSYVDPRRRAEFIARLAEDGSVSGFESQMLRKDGSAVWISTSAQASFGADGQIDYIDGIEEDITERKRAEAKLNEAAAIINRSPAVAFTWKNRKGWPVEFVSENVEKLVGYTAAEFTSGAISYKACVHPDDLERVAQEVVQFSKEDGRTEFVHEPYRIVRKDGAHRIISDWTFIVRDEQGNITHYKGIVEDITDGKRAEEALRDSQERHRAVFEYAGEGILIADIETKEFLHANPAVCDLLGYSEAELRQMSVGDIHPQESLEHVVSEFQAQARGEKTLAADIPCLRKDGTTIYVDINTTSLRLEGRRCNIGLFTDVTARRQAQEALAASEARYQEMFDTVHEGIGIVDENETIRFANPAYARIFDEDSVKNILGKNLFDYILEKQQETVLAQTSRRRAKEVSQYELDIVTGKGNPKTILVSVSPKLDSGGNYIGSVGAVLDITDRKRTEEALAISEARYQEVFNTVQEGIGIVDENEIIRFANPAYAKIFDEDSEENVLGKNLLDYVPEEQRKTVLAETSRRQAGEASQYELDIVTGKGNSKTILVSVSPKLDSGHNYKGAVGAVLDITDRKRTEEALQESEGRYRLLVENMDLGITLIDAEYNIIMTNQAHCRLLSRPVDELVNRKCYLEFEKRDDVCPHCPGSRAMATGEPAETETRMLNVDGSAFDARIRAFPILDPSGQSTGFIEIIEDITDRKRAEEEIRKFKTISDNANYGTAVADLQGKLLYVNACFAQMHGYSPDELMGKNLATLHSDGSAAGIQMMNEALIRDRSFASAEVWHVRRDGTRFPTLLNAVVIVDEDGAAQFLAATAVDMTETKRLQEFAERAQRLETAGRIAGQVAHDFNNLLGPLVAYPDLIREDLGSDHPLATYLDSMEVAAQQMADINQQLLTLGRRGHYNLEPLDLNQIVQQVIQQLQPHSRELVLQVNLDTNLMNIQAGAAQIFRVVSNLISNAVDAVPGTGNLTVRTENWYAEDTAGRYSQIPRGEYVKLTVSDTGCGIPEEALPQVFEPFFTTKRTNRKRGSGLGLSVVHAVVKDHNGYIDIESQAGRGTSVYVYFPATREQLPSTDTELLQGGSETILVVDDDDVQRQVTLRLLHKLGYSVEAADSGDAALEYLGNNHCDLMLLDMIMPGGMDGAETYRRALEINPTLKAVIVSGYAESERVAEAQRLGAGAFLKKPLALKSISVAVRTELDRARSGQPVG